MPTWCTCAFYWKRLTFIKLKLRLWAHTLMDDVIVVTYIFYIQSMIRCFSTRVLSFDYHFHWFRTQNIRSTSGYTTARTKKRNTVTPNSSLLLHFFPHCKRQIWVSTLHPKRPSSHCTQLPKHCTVCLFLYSLVYHNSLFELEPSNTLPFGKHQVINAIPGMLVWVIYAQTNVAPRLQVVLSATSLCTSRQCFWWLHLRDLPKCVCSPPSKVVSRVSALGLFTSKCFCDSPKQHESQCFFFTSPFLFPFYFLFVSRNTAFVI